MAGASSSRSRRAGSVEALGRASSSQEAHGEGPDLRLAALGNPGQQAHQRLSFVEEDPSVADRHALGQGGSEVGCCRDRVVVRVVCHGSHHASLHDAALVASLLGGRHHPVEQSDRLALRASGDQQPGEGEQVVLGEVRGRVTRDDPVLTRPGPQAACATGGCWSRSSSTWRCARSCSWRCEPGMDEAAAYGEALAAGTTPHGSVSELFFPPAVSLSTLTLPSVLGIFKPWGRVRRPAADKS
jgi:hypothetical protein